MSLRDDCDSVIWSPNCHNSAAYRICVMLVHDAEYPEAGTAAEDVGRFFSNRSVAASTTGTVDNNSTCGSVEYGMAAWHTGAGNPWNERCEGWEMPGYASQNRNEWLDVYGLQMLERHSRLYAKRLHANNIPCRLLTDEQFWHVIKVSGRPQDGGVASHGQLSRVAGIRGGHSDPGPNFPWDYWFERVQHFYYGGTPDKTIVTATPQPIMKAATMPHAHKFHDKPTVWITKMLPTGGPVGGQIPPGTPPEFNRATELWYVPMGDAEDIDAMIRNGDIASLRTLGAGPDKNGSPDNDLAFEHARAKGRVIGL